MPEQIVKVVRESEGLRRKRDIAVVTSLLAPLANLGESVLGLTDDAGAVRFAGGYLLLATDSIVPGLIEHLPYQAGRAAVLVNAADIYAMGGRPLAMVNHLSIVPHIRIEKILEGIETECHRLQIPMVGGHVHPDSSEFQLTVAVMGRATRILRTDRAEGGHDIIAAIDLNGESWGPGFKNWDSNLRKSSPQAIKDFSIMPVIARRELATAARDISNAGILGTLGFLLEASGGGGIIDLENIPRPDSVPLAEWVEYFPSYGFLLAAPPQNSPKILKLFSNRKISAARIGKVTRDKRVILKDKDKTSLLWNFDKEALLRLK
jgi:selenophosphate synthetase-related protein